MTPPILMFLIATLWSTTVLAGGDDNIDQLKRETISSFVSGGWSFFDLSGINDDTSLVTLAHPAACLQFVEDKCIRRPFRVGQLVSGELEPLFNEYSFCYIDLTEGGPKPRIHVHWQSSSYVIDLHPNQCVNGTGFKESSIVLRTFAKKEADRSPLPNDNGLLVFYRYVDQYVPLNENQIRTSGSPEGKPGKRILRSFE